MWHLPALDCLLISSLPKDILHRRGPAMLTGMQEARQGKLAVS